MKRILTIYTLPAMLFLACTLPISAQISAQGAGEERKALATLKRLIASVRLTKNRKALSYIVLGEMSRYLLGKYHKKFTPGQKTRFQSLLGEYIELRSFPKVLQYIKSIGLSYGKPKFKNGRVYVKSSLVYANAERAQFTWVLAKVGEKYLITDLIFAGKSSMKTQRDRAIQPLYKRKGARGLIRALEKSVKKLRR